MAIGVTFRYFALLDPGFPVLLSPSTLMFPGGNTLSFRIRVGLPGLSRISKTPFSCGAVAVAAASTVESASLEPFFLYFYRINSLY